MTSGVGWGESRVILRHVPDRTVAKVRWPERLEVFDAMPLTATRKIIEGRLVERLGRAVS